MFKMKIALAFPSDFGRVHSAPEALAITGCILIPRPVAVFGLQASPALIAALGAQGLRLLHAWGNSLSGTRGTRLGVGVRDFVQKWG